MPLPNDVSIMSAEPIPQFLTPVDLLIRLEAYGFQCEAGPLVLCRDWIQLKGVIHEMNELIESMKPAPPHCSPNPPELR